VAPRHRGSGIWANGACGLTEAWASRANGWRLSGAGRLLHEIHPANVRPLEPLVSPTFQAAVFLTEPGQRTSKSGEQAVARNSCVQPSQQASPTTLSLARRRHMA